MRVSVITVSDSCSKDRSLDKSGPALVNLFERSDRLKSVEVVNYVVVPDEFEQIRNALKECSSKSDVVVTTGGTGLSERDVTPEATKSVIERECLGIATAILMKGLEKTPMAALSRLTAGTCGRCLIVNLPGSQKAVIEGFEIIETLTPHAVSLLHENANQVKEDHEEILK